MKEDNKSSIIKEALSDYNEIMEAADANAKKKLAEEFPEKFQNLLKEEIQNKNKSKKESDKDMIKESKIEVDGIKSNKESDMKNQNKKETKKVVNEGDESKPFEEKPKNVEVVKEEREKDFMPDIESDTPNMADGQTEDGDTFVDGIATDKDSVAQKTSATTPDSKPVVQETFDVSELDVSSVGSAIEEADAEDEVITIQEIENEITNMSAKGDEEKPAAGKDNGDAFDELVKMRNKLDEMIGGMDEQKRHGGKGANDVTPGGPTKEKIEEEEVGFEDEIVGGMEEQKKHGGKGANKVNPGGPTQSMIDEEEITDADVEAVLGAPEGGAEEVEESLNQPISHSNSRQAGTKGLNQQQRANMRFAERPMNETKLIAENKKLTKKVNESKKLEKLVEDYKSVLQKYRNQLKEMAVFNSNLAHVNNLLVNESLALTQEDKIKIINEFKQVDSIAGSQQKYKTFLTEMKEGKTTLAESVEAKAGNSVAPSSKQKLDEVVESTAYENNEHVNNMKRIMEYMDTRGEKKIIE